MRPICFVLKGEKTKFESKIVKAFTYFHETEVASPGRPQNHNAKKEGVTRGSYLDEFTITIMDCFIFYILANLLRS